MHFISSASERMWFIVAESSAAEHFVGAAFAGCVHTLQRRFEQGLLPRKVHQGRMGSLLFRWKPTGSLLTLFPVVSFVAAPSRHSRRNGFFRRHRDGKRALRLAPACTY